MDIPKGKLVTQLTAAELMHLLSKRDAEEFKQIRVGDWIDTAYKMPRCSFDLLKPAS